MLLQWSIHSEEIVKQIKSREGFLKIILKTFNDGFFLEKWIQHHANIVGLENLVIADNMSTDEDVLAIYKKYERVIVFQFSGNHHNLIHDRKEFASLYDAFQLSCQYTLFIDTDEYLILIDENGWCLDRSIVNHLQSISPQGAIPSLWIQNVTHSDKIFSIGSNLERLHSGLRWGKPFIPSQFCEGGILIHNEQFPKVDFWSAKGATNFFLLHLTRLSDEQRIKVNKNKLIKRGFCSDSDDAYSIVLKSLADIRDPTINRLVDEIKECLINQSQPKKRYEKTPNGCLKLLPNGSLEFAGLAEQSLLEQFINNPELNIGLALKLQMEEAVKSMAEAIAFRNDGDYAAAEDAFNKGMEKYPNNLDQYGHPSFKKELMRTLLSQKKWEEAEKLIPNKDDLGGGYWHEILFARAYSQINDIANAKIWWTRLLKREPNNGEAKKFFSVLATHFPQPFKQILSIVPNQELEMIFDIGANVGQSCRVYAQVFPNATIYAFEPVPETFSKLSALVPNNRKVQLHNIALSDHNGTLDMVTSDTSTMNRVAFEPPIKNSIRIAAKTVATFCSERGIDHIDFMKIDTEGHDLSVLRGCSEFIRNVDFIQCEASANEYNRYHNSFVDIFNFMTNAGFYLFHLDGFTYEWANGGYPVLRRFDPIFINGRVVGKMKNVVDR